MAINDPITEDEGDHEIPPPSAERVAHRALILAAVACRGSIDGNPASSTLAQSVQDWVFTSGLSEELSGWERRLLETPFGNLVAGDRINASWLSEALTILAWSLNKVELPSFEEQCDPSATAGRLGFLNPLNATCLNRPVLRPLDVLRDYNRFVYNLHWRIRDFSLFQRPYDFESLARKAWGEPIQRYGLTLVENDIAVGGVPIFRAEKSALANVTSITQERHRASNWLIGYESEDFYEVTTDT